MKIKHLYIKSFRGIPNSLSLSFTHSNALPCSVIIFGDNGSGKSSIVDALEFNLQGKIERSESLQDEFKASPLNWQNKANLGSETKCIFDDGSENIRNINVILDELTGLYNLTKSTNGLHPNFQIAPVVLRRKDIITYSSTPNQRKQVLFWSFLYKDSSNPGIAQGSHQDQISFYENERKRLKNERKILVEKLASSLNITSEDIPLDNNDLNIFIKNRIRNGLTMKQYLGFKRRGVLKGINHDAIIHSDSIIDINTSIKDVQSKIRRLKNFTSDSSELKKKETRRFLQEASMHLTEAFLSISTTTFVEEINVRIGELTEVSFEIEVVLKNGKKTTPNNIFSEANLDLIVLLLYTSIIRESEKYGQAKVLILDDVLQSVDSIIRLNFIEYILSYFKDWQIIISAHDRLWLNQMRSSFSRHQHRFKEIEILKWDFLVGPKIIESNNRGDNSSLLAALDSHNVQLIASQAGLLFESICHNLSMTLNTSIQRKRDDRYTIGDLWPGIKKHFKNTGLAILSNDIDKLIHIRNLLGAHYNEWATSLSNTEIFKFAESVNTLYVETFCNHCQSWIGKQNICNCKSTKVG